MRLVALAKEPLTRPDEEILAELREVDGARTWARGPGGGNGAGRPGLFIGLGGGGELQLRLQRIEENLTEPLDPQVVARCWWLDQTDIAASHRLHYVLSIPEADETWVMATEAARLLTRVMARLSYDPALVGIWNPGASVLFAPEHMHGFARRAGAGEVPLQLWLGLTYHLDKPGLVSATTSGLAEFMGFEVEMWDAPWSVETAGEKITALLRYLLRHGPVLREGGGVTTPDRIHYRFGFSRVARPNPVQAMFLEVAAPSVPITGRIGEGRPTGRTRKRPGRGAVPGR